MLTSSIIDQFRLIGLIEGISYLVLLFVAMPIKYLLGDPSYVKVIGMAHGILFMLFVAAQFRAALKYRFDLKENALYFVASLIPFGTFFTDKRLKNLKSTKVHA
ncbi:MAG: membrane protein [Sulfurovum sp. PC08-66]|jgi:integral membrane protein|nr:MAG: membrane protein [Sulfurovum sp. PC08-66]